MSSKDVSGKDMGMALVEVIIASAIVLLVASFVSVTVYQFSQVRNTVLQTTKKTYLADEGYEIVRLLRDQNWSNFSTLPKNTFIYLNVSTTTISTSTSPEVIEGVYTRSFKLFDVYRSAAKNIVASTTSGASVDSGSREAVIYVRDANGTTTLRSVLTSYKSI